MTFGVTQQLMLANDPELPQRDKLLDPSFVGARLSETLRKRGFESLDRFDIVRTKYRFGKNIRILYKLCSGQRSVMVSARTFNSAQFAKIVRADSTGEPRSGADLLDAKLNTAFWIFPNDRKIASLGIISHVPDEVREILPEWTASRLAAYAPEKCATFVCLGNGERVIAYSKIYAEGAGTSVRLVYEHLRDRDIRLPKVMGVSERHQTIILEAIEGKRLADAGGNSVEIYRELGAAIARLHQVPTAACLPPFQRLERGRLFRAHDVIAMARPDIKDHVAKLVQKLNAKSLSSGPEVCLHGDVHPKNAIWKDGALTLIDLDQVSRGDAAADIGSFLAGQYYKQCLGEISADMRTQITNAFLSGYAKFRDVPGANDLNWSTASALFAERALRSVTRMRLEGQKNMSRILTAADNILERTSV